MPENIRRTDSANENDIESNYRAEADRLKLFFEVTKYGLYDWNLQTKEFYANSIFITMLGYREDEIQVSPEFFYNHIHPDDLISVKTVFDEYSQGRESHEIEYRIRKKSGEYLWILSSGKLIKCDKDGQPLRIIGMHSDITEKKNISAKFLDSEERFFKVFHMSLDLCAITSFPEGRFLDVNEAFLSTTGYKREEIIGNNSSDVKIWGSSQQRNKILQLIRQNGSCKDIEVTGYTKSGIMVFGLFSAKLINLNSGPVVYGIYKDITKRKQTFDILFMQKELSIKLAGASELKEIGDYVLKALKKLEEIDSGGLYICDSVTGELNLISHSGLSNSFVESISHYDRVAPQAQIVAKGEPLYISYSELNVPKNEIQIKEGLKQLSIIPIKSKNTVIANLNLASHKHDEVSPEVRESLEAIAGILGDSIARVLSETAIREVNARLNAVIESPKDISIFSLNTDYCYTAFNKIHERQMLALLNINIKIGMNFLNIFPVEKRFEPAEQDIGRALKGESVENVYELSGKYFEFAFNPIFGDNRQVIGVSCFIQDITERKLAEDALRESEKKFSTIIETAAEGILIADSETKKFNYANSEICSMLGYTREELSWKSPNDIHPKESLHHVIVQFEALKNGKIKIAASVPIVRKNGTIFFADVRASVITIGGIQNVVGFFTDITERKQALDILHIQKDMSIALAGAAEFKELGDIVLQAVTQLDGIDSGGLYIRNRETGELNLIAHKGVPDSFVKTVSCYGPDTPQAQIVEKGEPICIDYSELDNINTEGLKLLFIIPIKHENKVVANLNLASHTRNELLSGIRDSVEAIAGILGDSIARVRTETAIREINARVNSIMESPKDICIYSLDTNTCFTSFNEAYKRTTLANNNIEIKIGMNILDLFTSPSMRKDVKQDYERAFKGESFTKTIKILDLFYELTINPIYEKNQKVIGVSCFVWDITQQRNMEEKLRQSEKMEAIGQLAGGIAHDFNNELSVISGYSELLLDEVKSDPNLVSYVDSILKGIKRSANLISQMLAFSRKGKFLSTSVDIHEVISEIILMLEHSIDKRIVIEQNLKADPSITLGDPSQIKSAILNLALNARDAMPDGGELLFSTDIVDINDEMYKNAPYYINLGKYISISVSDSGIGMDKKIQKRLFEPFFTTKGQGKGTGFGLASVYGTVKNHNGMINVYSEPGHGSTFRVYLPVAEISEANKKIDTDPVKSAKISANILLVDDEDDLRIVGQKILVKLGYKVTVCKDGKEAVKFYEKSWNKIDIVILDMIMPVMNGRDAFIAMKKINPDIKALLMSGYSLNGEAQAILNKGVKGFLQKPFKQNELSRQIIEVLNIKSKPASSQKSKNKKL